jgi:hypothetical protein
MNRCRSCPAPVLWAKHKDTGKSNPLDLEPSPQGNCLVSMDDHSETVYEMLTGDDLDRAKAQCLALYISHFATCPNSRQHRREKGSRPRQSRPAGHPPELLASVTEPDAAREVAKIVATTFHVSTFIKHKSGDNHPFHVVTPKQLTDDERRTIREFLRDYALKQAGVS